MNTKQALLQDSWPSFWDHNERLFNEMLSNGFAFKDNGTTAHFVNAAGEYQSFPRGYITGVGYSDNGSPTPYYASICLGDSWNQRSFKTREDAVAWALATAAEMDAAKS